MKKYSLLILSFLLAVFVLAACGDKDEEESKEPADDGQGAEMQEPDLEDIPKVVAEVNGEEISKEDFENMYQQQFQNQMMQAQMSGQEIDEDALKKQTAEGMVGQELLVQEANNRFEKADEDDVDKLIEDLIEQSGSESKEDLIAQFDEQGIDEDEFMSEVEKQVKIDQLMDEEAGDLEPSEDEVKEAYEAMKSQQEEMMEGAEDGEAEEIPEFDEMKPQIEDQLKQQKQAEEMQNIVDKLREDADVTVHI